MISVSEFNTKAAILVSKLNMLWVLMRRQQEGTLMDEGVSLFSRTLREANLLHREMFPELEHDLYSDDVMMEFIEGEDEDE
jgi:hypothetical protein